MHGSDENSKKKGATGAETNSAPVSATPPTLQQERKNILGDIVLGALGSGLWEVGSDVVKALLRQSLGFLDSHPGGHWDNLRSENPSQGGRASILEVRAKAKDIANGMVLGFELQSMSRYFEDFSDYLSGHEAELTEILNVFLRSEGEEEQIVNLRERLDFYFASASAANLGESLRAATDVDRPRSRL